jgi:predicted MPP superfamily phosphohydrolase
MMRSTPSSPSAKCGVIIIDVQNCDWELIINKINLTKMNILHLTDFHYSTKGKDPSKIVKAIIEKIKEENRQIDFIFFTGDLVNV